MSLIVSPLKQTIMHSLQPVLLKELSSIVYDYSLPIKVQISSQKATPEELAYKTNLLGRAVRYIDYHLHLNDDENPNIALKIQEYFYSMLSRLSKGENVLLGRWYHSVGHASHNSIEQAWSKVDEIITDKTIMQLRAPQGYGAYFSTHDESRQQYGVTSFVFGEEAFSKMTLGDNREVHYFPGDPIYSSSTKKEKLNRYTSLWIRVMNSAERQEELPCVPVNETTVAFMTAPTCHVEALQKKLDSFQFNVSVLDHEEMNFIQLVFDSIQTQRAPHAQDHLSKPLIQVYNKSTNQLLFVGGRPIPLDWQPHGMRVNFSSPGFPRHMQHLQWQDDNRGRDNALTVVFAP